MLTRKNIYHYILYVVFALIFFCGIGLYSVSLNPVSSDNGALVLMLIRYAIVFMVAAPFALWGVDSLVLDECNLLSKNESSISHLMSVPIPVTF